MKQRIFLLLTALLLASAAHADGLDRDQAGIDAAERARRAAAENAGDGGKSGGTDSDAATSGTSGNAGRSSTSGKGLGEKAREIRDRAKQNADSDGAKASRLKCLAKDIDGGTDVPYPGVENIHHTNNLRRPTGIAINAVGDRIYFTGTLVDSNCVPIQDALVEIWQADNGGSYSSTDENFLGSGRTETSNEGLFTFLTIFPGGSKGRSPHVNFRITHPDFQETTGEIFFEAHPQNVKDPTFRKIRGAGVEPYLTQSVTLGEDEIYTDRKYHIKIALKGTSTYKRF